MAEKVSVDVKLAVARFSNAKSNRVVQEEHSWGSLGDLLTQHVERKNKDGPLWSPTFYGSAVNRSKSNVLAMSCLVLDFDTGVSPEVFARGWDRFAYAMHTTFKHTTEHPRWRVVFPLARPISGEEWPIAWQRLTEHFGGGSADPVCKDASRIYYLPSCPPEADRGAVLHEGEWISPDEFLRPTVDYLIGRAKDRLSEGRNSAGMWLACQMRDNGYTQAETESVDWHREVPREKHSGNGRVDLYTRNEWIDTVRKVYRVSARQPWKPRESETVSVNGKEGDEKHEVIPADLIRANSCNSCFPEYWPEPMASEAFVGPAGAFVREMLPYSEADPAALLVNFLVCAGNIIGRRVYSVAQGVRHHTNLFAAMVGTTSEGRKGTSLSPALSFFGRLDEEWKRDHVSRGCLSSGEGLIARVRDREGETDKRLLVVQSEFGGVLKVMTREGNVLDVIAKEAWDHGDLEMLVKNNHQRATGAHISIIAHITPVELLSMLTTTSAASGFGNRFLWVATKRSKWLPEGGELPPVSIVLISIRTLVLHEEKVIGRSDDAKRMWAAVYPVLGTRPEGIYGAITGRAQPQVLRLSLIYAMLDNVNEIGEKHLLAALAVWDYCERSAAYVFGDAQGDPGMDRILSLLSPEHPTTTTEICDAFGRNVSATRYRPWLRMLLERRLIRGETIKPERGRPIEQWYLVNQGEKTATALEIARELVR